MRFLVNRKIGKNIKKEKFMNVGKTYSVDSTTGDDGIIINIQFVRIVVMMNNENNGWTRI